MHLHMSTTKGMKGEMPVCRTATDVLKSKIGWMWWASHIKIKAFRELYQKIKRYREHILNTTRLGMSNARIETTNNKIKLIIHKAYGFRNIQNMLDMVYLVCSDMKVFHFPTENPESLNQHKL